jgi:uncharacterized LabA/DUF88 family protein
MVYFRKEERLAVFIDGASLSMAVTALDFDVDFRRFSRLFQENSNLIRIYFYAMVPNENASIRTLIDWLDYNDYTVAAKTGRTLLDDAGKRRNTGDFAVDLAVDALRLARTIDHVTIVSGNSRYRPLVAGLQQMGCRVSVVSTLRPQPLIDEDLRRQADQFIDLADLREQIERGKAAAATAA